jgi:hypothetical protein
MKTKLTFLLSLIFLWFESGGKKHGDTLWIRMKTYKLNTGAMVISAVRSITILMGKKKDWERIGMNPEQRKVNANTAQGE